MNTLLIGGAPNTGKSNAVVMCAHYFANKGFTLHDCRNYNGNQIPLPQIATGSKPSTDFLAKFIGSDKNDRQITVIITSASDTTGIIDVNYNYFQNQSCDIYISSIRDIGFERKYLFSKLNFTNDEKNIIEFPLAKMSRRNKNWYKAKTWYDSAVQNMLGFVLGSKPFAL